MSDRFTSGGWLAGALACALPSCALLCGCDDGGGTDGGAADAGSPDTGPGDAGDGGGDDAGPRDAGGADSGLPAVAADLCDPSFDPGPYPSPDAWPENEGPGGPAATFDESELYDNCTRLSDEADTEEHHNLVTMYDGYLLMPWAPEWGGMNRDGPARAGITLWDVSDPCNPTRVGGGLSQTMRESHSIGFSSLHGRWAVVDSLTSHIPEPAGGIEFWDLSDTREPKPVRSLELEGFLYPEAYARVVLSVFWQVPYVYAAGGNNGIYVIDATDPTEPTVVNRYVPEPVMQTGQVQAIGSLLVVTAAEGARTVLLDISDPESPMPIPGGDFLARDGAGEPREAYFTNFANGMVWYARKDSGGGVIAMDVRDPTSPVYAGDHVSDGNGGYVFVKDDFAFTGESNFAAIYDVSDPSSITEVARLHLDGDLDTMTPIGNVVVLSVDDPAEGPDGELEPASAVAPWRTEPDTQPPSVTWVWPDDGATDVPVSSRIGLTFSEMVDVASAWEGSVRLYETNGDKDDTRVPGVVSAQEVIVNFHPRCPLEPGTEYTIEVPAGGVTDFNGNAVGETFTATFTTAGG